jgi:DNA-binding NtrC family response regulator
LPRKTHLLLVDDDPNTLASLSRAFRLAGHEATVCDNAGRAMELLRTETFDVIFSDVVMPGKSGIELLEDLKKAGITTPIILISGQANVEMAVRATKLGALDFLEKPLSTDKLLVTVENALRLKRLEDENRELRSKLGKHELVGSGPAMTKLQAQIARVGASETRVCILGETGTGKELVARAIHEKSARRENAFVTLNCAAVPAELIESELFGHEKGAFTGAAAKHLGKFEQAEGGTLFLDEIGDMPVAMQAKLLRVLEEGEVERVGGDKTIRVNVRVVVATHRNLEELVKQNAFRRDLFHRIYVFPLLLPPLRERAEDFPSLEREDLRRCGDCRTAALFLAGECARTAQRGGTTGSAGSGRCGERRGCSSGLASDGRSNDWNVGPFFRRRRSRSRDAGRAIGGVRTRSFDCGN